MNYLKKVGKAFIYIMAILLIGTFLISLLNYINLIRGKVFTIFKVIIPMISLLVGGFMMGKNSKSKGWLEGIKLGGIFILFLFIFNFLALGNAPEFKTIIYYFILLAACVFGSMFGITKSNINEKN